MSQEVESKIKMGDYPDPENYSLCSHFIDAFATIGKKWNGLIISSLCDTNVMRSEDSACCISKCSDRVLVGRLKELEKDGIADRTVDEKGGIVGYTLIQKSADLQPVSEQVHSWTDKQA